MNGSHKDIVKNWVHFGLANTTEKQVFKRTIKQYLEYSNPP